MVKFRSLRRDEGGVIIIIVALMFPVLIAFMGLSLDFGLIFHWKRRQQRAADAAAIGAATELWRGNDVATAQSAGHDDAAVNGFDEADTSRNINVEINIPYNGLNTMAEAVITELQVPTYFLRVLGYADLAVTSRAVAGSVSGYSTACIWVLDEDDPSSLTVQGTIEVNSDCEVMVNSDAANAIKVNGGACLEATYVGTVGGYVNNGQANATCMGNEELWLATDLGIPAYYDGAEGTTSDPLLQYRPTIPDVTVAAVATDVEVQDGDPPYFFTPGRYYGSTIPKYDPSTGALIGYGTNIAIRITGGQAYFAPGLYIIDSGMTINGGVTRVSNDGGVTSSLVAGDPGVSFYFTENATDLDNDWNFITINGNADVKFVAPYSGQTEGLPSGIESEYEGWLFWEDAAAPDNKPGHRIVGTSDSLFVGVIYFPTRDLFWGGESTTADWVMIAVDNLTIAGTASIPTGGLNSSSVPNPIKTVTLLE